MVAEVVVTGLGVVNGSGHDPSALVDALVDERSLTRCVDGERGPLLGAPANGFRAAEWLGAQSARRLGRAAQLAAVAGETAVAAADLEGAYEPARCAVVEATSVGSLAETLAFHRHRLAGRRGVGTRLVSTAMNGTAGSWLCSRRQFRGPALALSNGSCSSASALGVGRDLVRSGSADLVVVAAGEAPLFTEMLTLFAEARLGSRNTSAPARACRPFDRERDGTVLAEAGAAIVLERASEARARGAPVLARLVGVEQTSEGVNGVRPVDDVTQRARAIRGALRQAGAAPADVDWVCAHGTATPANDPHEAEAIRAALGPAAATAHVTALKSTLGHALGACSLLELVAAVACMRRGVIPPTWTLEHVAEGCELRHVRERPLTKPVRLAVLNSASFGGRNASIAVAAA